MTIIYFKMNYGLEKKAKTVYLQLKYCLLRLFTVKRERIEYFRLDLACFTRHSIKLARWKNARVQLDINR